MVVHLKFFCQNRKCCENHTKDRYHKASQTFRGRYAYFKLDDNNNSFALFCTTACQQEWLNDNIRNIVEGRAIPFLSERLYEKKKYRAFKSEHGWWNYEPLDNGAE